MPLIVESLARGAQVQNPRESKWLMLHTRMAAELGADVIKTENAEDNRDHAQGGQRLSRSNPGPWRKPHWIGRGSGQYGPTPLCTLGQRGVFFGRNIFQSANMSDLLLRIHSALADKVSVQGK